MGVHRLQPPPVMLLGLGLAGRLVKRLWCNVRAGSSRTFRDVSTTADRPRRVPHRSGDEWMKDTRTILASRASSGISAATVREQPGQTQLIRAGGRGSGQDNWLSESTGRHHKADTRGRKRGHALSGSAGFAGPGRCWSETTLLPVPARSDGIVSNAGFADRTRSSRLSRARLDESLRVMTGLFFDLARTAARQRARIRPGAGSFTDPSSRTVMPLTDCSPSRRQPRSQAGSAGARIRRGIRAERHHRQLRRSHTRKDASGHRAIRHHAGQEMAALPRANRPHCANPMTSRPLSLSC